MPEYRAPIRDFEFILKEFLSLEDYKELEGFEAIDDAFISAIIGEGAKLCEEVLFPLNQSGDAEGVRLVDGEVKLPQGFVEAYQTYSQSGWTSMTCDPTYGGQGLPEVVSIPMVEMMCSSNLSFGMTPGLTHGAYNALHTHGSDEVKARYLPPMVDGRWSGVMCLTEPQCGTDLGLIRTKAEIQDDGSYAITGSKIFISSGDQDATENIIHLVLARTPDAPKGVKGISLFVVPKLWVNEDGSLGAANHVSCGAVEHKMGIHGSPTCVMNYEGAKGYLVGELNKGLRAMFTMMNEARLYVGIQGLGLAEIAYQNAVTYAKDRLQGRALKGVQYPDKVADPLLVHPDVRRMLLTIKSFTEGARALSCFTALKLDISKRHNDDAVRTQADDFVQFVTPILKAYLTDGGFDSTNLALQIYGGHGYIREYGVEQYVRDARIAQIYEGANGIQALDLVGRKLTKHTGRYLRSFFHEAMAFIEENRENEAMATFNKPLYQIVKSAQQASLWIAANGMGNPDEAASGSVEYLRLMAITVMAYMWARMVKVSIEALDNDANSEVEFYRAKIATGKFFMQKVVPAHYSLLASITAGSESIMSVDEAWF